MGSTTSKNKATAKTKQKTTTEKHSTKESKQHIKQIKQTLALGLNKSINAYVQAKSSKKIFTNYELGRMLGKSMTGETFIAKQKSTGYSRVIKQIHKSKMALPAEGGLVEEFKLLQSLSHPLVSKIYEIYEDASSIYLVTEFYEGGDLLHYIQSNKNCAYEQYTSAIIKQVLTGLAYCHSQNIIIRDLKPQSVLFIDKQQQSIILSDVGLTKFYNKDEYIKQRVGSLYFMSPEIINDKPDAITSKADIWSIGIIAYMMLSGSLPLKTQSIGVLFESITTLEIVDDETTFPEAYFSKEAKDFIMQTVKHFPKDRKSAIELLKHPWLSTVDAIKSQELTNIVSKIKSNISKLSGKSILQETLINYVANNSNKLNCQKDIQNLFMKIDADKDGKVTKDEFVMGLRNYPSEIHLSVKDLEEIFNKMDTNQNNSVEFNEFIRVMGDFNEMTNERNLKAAFDYFDIDGNGYITAGEINSLFTAGTGTSMNEESISVLINEASHKNDGKISFEDLKLLIKCSAK